MVQQEVLVYFTSSENVSMRSLKAMYRICGRGITAHITEKQSDLF